MIYIAVAPSHWNILEPPPHPLTCRCSTAGAHCDGCQHHHELESGGDWASFGGPQKSSLETEFFICCNGETLQWSPGKLWLTGNLVMFKEEVSEAFSMDNHGASLLRRPTQDPSMAHVES